MRALLRWSQSNQGCLAITLLVLIVYLGFYRPLDAKTIAMDAPLRQSWKKLMAANQQSLTPDRLDLDNISKGLKEIEQQQLDVPDANQALLSRVAIDPAFEARTQQAFQLIDYQNERLSNIEALTKLAGERKTTIAKEVFDGFPVFYSDQRAPNLLWGDLNLTHHLVQTAIYAGVESVAKLKTQRQALPTATEETKPLLTRLVSEIEFECHSARLARLLVALPLRSEELNAALGLKYPAHKPSLYVDQILIRKNSREQPARVKVWMKTVGFIVVAPPQGEP